MHMHVIVQFNQVTPSSHTNELCAIFHKQCLFHCRNALNIVKDDLIVKVDELTGEIEILREELNTANQSRAKLRQKVSELEDELKQSKTLVKANSKLTFPFRIEKEGKLKIISNIVSMQTIQIKKMKAMFLWRSASDSLGSKWLGFLWKEIK